VLPAPPVLPARVVAGLWVSRPAREASRVDPYHARLTRAIAMRCVPVLPTIVAVSCPVCPALLPAGSMR